MMKRVLVASGLLVALAAAVLPTSRAAADSGTLACVAVRTEARYVPYGYNHVVILTSSCKKDASCTVSTDVNPQPTVADVAAGTTVEVVTFMGSPAQSFSAKVSCRAK